MLVTSLYSTKRKVRYLTISDVHLGHSKNPTKEIVQNLHAYFDQYSDKSIFARTLDIIFIAGDLFDQLINASADPLYEALEFITRLIDFCERNKIKLRILEGTPSHDRRQCRLFESVCQFRASKSTVDVKWIKTLMVENIEDLELSVLYIPDEFTDSTETTQKLVEELFKEQGISTVDIGIMHGVFKYQMCNIPGKHDTHDEEFYLSIVEHFINIGHHHVFTTYLRIIAQGSFDRLVHGEPEPKGAAMMTIRDNGEDYYEFIENKHAKIFKTIELFDSSLEESLRQIDLALKKVPNDSFIRIKAVKLHPVFAYLPELKKKYFTLHFSKLSVEEEQEQQKGIQASVDRSYQVIEIRPENVVDLIVLESDTQNLNPDFDRKYLRNLLSNLQTV